MQTTHYMLCMTSGQKVDVPNILALDVADIENGSLNEQSHVRPTHIMTVGENRILRTIGNLNSVKLTALSDCVIGI